MKFFFNTKTFEHHYHEISVTKNMEEAEFLVMGAKTVPIEEFVNLRAVYRFGVGADNVPFEYLRQKEIPVYFPSDETKNILFDSTANFASYLILYMNYSPHLGKIEGWKKDTREYAGNKTILVIGTGNIGSRVAAKMKQFMKVLTFDCAYDSFSELKNLIMSSDYISLHIPVSPENIGFVDKEKLSWMKDDVVLINTARGVLTDEEALYERLNSTAMRAAFDVFWVEPYHGKLSTLPREKFFMTPHTSSQTRDFVEAGFSEILKIAEEIEKQ
jgi:phosphoglycerate dehydrogenase-like enzyme